MKLTPRAESCYRLQDYGDPPSIEGVELSELGRASGESGSLVELLRLDEEGRGALSGFRLAQINYATLEPGVTKAFHVHRRQTDVWFIPPEDRVLAVLIDVRAGSPTDGRQLRLLLGGGQALLLRIPPGVAHGCRNLGPRAARMVYFADQQFSPEPAETDEGRLPWDFVGRQVWEVAWD